MVHYPRFVMVLSLTFKIFDFHLICKGRISFERVVWTTSGHHDSRIPHETNEMYRHEGGGTYR